MQLLVAEFHNIVILQRLKKSPFGGAFQVQAFRTGDENAGGPFHYRVRRLEPADAPLISRRYAREEPVPAGLECRLSPLLEQLFSQRLVQGGIVERRTTQDTQWTPAAYGMITFLSPEFFERHLSDPHPFLGIHVLERLAVGHVRDTVLDQRELCRLNAATRPVLAMCALCWHQDNYDFTSADGQKQLEGAFHLMERYLSGYNLKHFIFEGRAAYRHVSEKVGFTRMIDFSDDKRAEFAPLRADPRYRPHLHCIYTRRAGPLIPSAPITRLFAYKPPVLHFSEAQKQVLELALEGLSDDEIARRCEVGRNAIQMRWRKIYARFEQHVPGLLGDSGKTAQRARGPEKRRQVLQYLREHPQELRPWCARRSRPQPQHS